MKTLCRINAVVFSAAGTMNLLTAIRDHSLKWGMVAALFFLTAICFALATRDAKEKP